MRKILMAFSNIVSRLVRSEIYLLSLEQMLLSASDNNGGTPLPSVLFLSRLSSPSLDLLLRYNKQALQTIDPSTVSVNHNC